MAIATLSPAPQAAGLSLPLRLEQERSKTSALMLLGLLLPVAGSVLVPFGMIALAGPNLLAMALDNPLAMAQLSLGALMWIGLFVVPVSIFARRHGIARTVDVTATDVTITETSALGRQTRVVPLGQYDGLVHVVRTSVSGIRHELLLVDFATRTRTVIHVADRIGRETVEEASQLLGLPEIAARDAIDLSFTRARAVPATATGAQPTALAA